jgi:DtxR family transcriptional regulator, Mn-dependent transcriptional regulator
VHSGEVAVRVGVSNASVTHAFRVLREHGLIEYERYQAVQLTTEGSRIARQVMKRKQALTRFFADVLNLDQTEAEQNAHRMEHVISPAAVERLEELVDSLAGRTAHELDRATPERPAPTDQ